MKLFKRNFYGAEFGFHCANSKAYIYFEMVFKMVFNCIYFSYFFIIFVE